MKRIAVKSGDLTDATFGDVLRNLYGDSEEVKRGANFPEGEPARPVARLLLEKQLNSFRSDSEVVYDEEIFGIVDDSATGG